MQVTCGLLFVLDYNPFTVSLTCVTPSVNHPDHHHVSGGPPSSAVVRHLLCDSILRHSAYLHGNYVLP